MNALLVAMAVRGRTGDLLAEVERSFGTREWIPGYLDFWPFLSVTKIPAGEAREIAVALPPRAERVTAEVRYRDWFAIQDQDRVIARISRRTGDAASRAVRAGAEDPANADPGGGTGSR